VTSTPDPGPELIAAIEAINTGHQLDPALAEIAAADYQPGALLTLAQIRSLDSTTPDAA